MVNPRWLKPLVAFSAVVPTDGTLISTDLLNGLISVDAEQNIAEVWSGTRLHQLGPALDAQGQALTNLPDINYQTIGTEKDIYNSISVNQIIAFAKNTFKKISIDFGYER